MATRQLNLHHAGRLENNTCRKQPGCRGEVGTWAHLFWDCPYAVALWDKMIGHWTGERATRQRTQQYFSECASRRVVSIPVHRKARLVDRFPDDYDEAVRMWQRIWRILATICQAKLRADRNDAVYQAARKDFTSTVTSFWTTCICQLRASAIREHR